MAALLVYVILLALSTFNSCQLSCAADPDPLQDFCVTDPTHSTTQNGFPCKPPSHVSSADFKSSALVSPGNTSSNPFGIALTLASASSFGALNTQGLSFARIDYAKCGVVPPHVHPRASEILFVLDGTLSVGFVDTANKLYKETLCAGELFVFPRGLLHFIYNVGAGRAVTLSGFNSQNPGTSLVANALFGAEPPVSDEVLEKAFQLSEKEVKSLKKVFG